MPLTYPQHRLPSALLCCLPWTTLATQAALQEWQSAVQSGTAPASTYFKDETGPAISGLYPVNWDVGALTGDRTFEFVVFAGETGGSSALMGFSGSQGLKFEQWQDTGNLGLTDYGVADHVAAAPSPFYRETHLVYAFDGSDTHLYVDGEWVHTFAGVPLEAAGSQWLGAVSDDQGLAFGDRLDGRILGFASYDIALPAAEITTHASAFRSNTTSSFLAAWQTEVASGTAPVTTVFTPVSGHAPVIIDVGDLAGAPATFEFVVHAGEGGASSAVAGLRTAATGQGQGLKFEQWENTTSWGLTNFSVVDITADSPSPFDRWTHAAFVSDGLSTELYVDGQWQATFDNAPLLLGGPIALGAAATATVNIEGLSTRDPMDGTVIRFASYDTSLSESEIQAHHAAFIADAGAGSFSAWQAAVAAGIPATSSRLEPATAGDLVTVDVGPLSGDRTFEFIVNATDSGPSGSLMGDFVQSLRFEQWNDTGTMGLTVYGVADHTTSVFPPLSIDTHIVYASDGTDTHLYVDGIWQHTFAGVPLTGSGPQGLALSAAVTTGGTTFSFFDVLDGHVLGFAAYASAVPQNELARHATALFTGGATPLTPLAITAFSRDPSTGQLTLTWTSSAGKTYDILHSTDLASFGQVTAAGIAGTAGTTSHTFNPPLPQAPQIYFRVREQ